MPKENCPTIIIHRGTHQIGGCVTEIRSKSGTRIAIDIGENLPSLEKEKQKQLKIPGLTKYTRNNKQEKKFDAVFVTHYHGDHVGLYNSVVKDIPIYAGEHTKNIYKMLQERILPGKVRRREISQREANQRLKRINDFNIYSEDKPVRKGDIKITPIKSDHSAFDAHMLLIECDGKKILHTGDFRLHGIMGSELFKKLEKNVTKIDYLICEGTTLSRGDSKDNLKIQSEDDIGKEAKKIFKENKYNFVYCSSTNIDRIAEIYEAANSNHRLFVCDEYQKLVLEYINFVAEKENLSNIYKFGKNKVKTYGNNLTQIMDKNGFVMIVRANKLFKKIMNNWKTDSTFIYSTWDGYLLEEYYELYKNIQDFVPKDSKLIYLHTSGHADRESIKKVINILKPETIIPIHGETPEMFEKIGLKNCKIVILHDEEEYYI